jgi:hypothetical protein
MTTARSAAAKWGYWRGYRAGQEEVIAALRELLDAAYAAADELDEVNSDARYYGQDLPYYCGYSGRGIRATANRIAQEFEKQLEDDRA